MSFSSGVFLLLFLPILFIIYYLPISNLFGVSWKNVILLIFSMLFYMWSEPKFLLLLIAYVLIDWLLGKLMVKWGGFGKKLLLCLGISLHLSSLFLFKYLNFFVSQFSKLYDGKVYQVVMPLGLSFFTFQMIGYLVDVYKGIVPPQRSIINLGLYFFFFPKLIMGPIVRYKEVEHQLCERYVSTEDIYTGINRFIVGLAKKVILADSLAIISDSFFSATNYVSVSCLGAWLGAVTYTLEIYFDFSGYSDMAIGLARMFGFRFPENFNYPYIATSINDFWKRWHISLTSWFREYVYIPLGGNRHGEIKHIRNLIIVWLLTGIWHGANWTFMVWGIIYCVLVLVERYLMTNIKIPKGVGWFGTILVVIINWVIFKSDSIGQAVCYLGYMFGYNTSLYDEAFIGLFSQSIVMVLLAIACCVPWKNFCCRISFPCGNLVKVGKIFVWGIRHALLFVILLISISMVISGKYSPYIYFNF